MEKIGSGVSLYYSASFSYFSHSLYDGTGESVQIFQIYLYGCNMCTMRSGFLG